MRSKYSTFLLLKNRKTQNNNVIMKIAKVNVIFAGSENDG